jgi:hypothetical protein
VQLVLDSASNEQAVVLTLRKRVVAEVDKRTRRTKARKRPENRRRTSVKDREWWKQESEGPPQPESFLYTRTLSKPRARTVPRTVETVVRHRAEPEVVNLENKHDHTHTFLSRASSPGAVLV